jgi:hypothetical protein
MNDNIIVFLNLFISMKVCLTVFVYNFSFDMYGDDDCVQQISLPNHELVGFFFHIKYLHKERIHLLTHRP